MGGRATCIGSGSEGSMGKDGKEEEGSMGRGGVTVLPF